MRHLKHLLLGPVAGLLLAAGGALALTVLVQRTQISPGTNTNGVAQVRSIYTAVIHRIILTGPAGASGVATGTVSLTDMDGTAIASATLTNTMLVSGSVTSWPASTVTTSGIWYANKPLLAVTNASTSNLTFTATSTEEE
jgi:hypothetical protein